MRFFFLFFCLLSRWFILFFSVLVRVVNPSAPTAPGSKAAGERASPAAFPSYPARRNRVSHAANSHQPSKQSRLPVSKRLRHPINPQHQRPTCLGDTHPGGRGLQRPVTVCRAAGQGRAGGAGRTRPGLWEPWSRERFSLLRAWKRADRSGSSHCSSSSTEWDWFILLWWF